MKFTGHNLEMLGWGIELALAELHNQVGSCPDVNAYAEELDELEVHQMRFRRLLKRIERAIARERSRVHE